MKIEDYLTDDKLWDLAVFLKRVTYNDVFEHTEGDGEYWKNRAYKYIEAINGCKKNARGYGE
jgi:hypothetical protein